MKQPERRDGTLAELGRDAVRRTLEQHADACPTWPALIRYALLRARRTTPAPEDPLREVGLHQAFCADCTQRYRLVRAALGRGQTAQLQLSRLLKGAPDERGRRRWTSLGAHLMELIDATLRPQAVPVTLGSQVATLRARALDPSGRAVEQVLFNVEAGPEVQAGVFILRLSTDALYYNGSTLGVALILDREAELELALGRARLRQGTVDFRCELGELGLTFEPVIPLELVRVSVTKRAASKES